MDCAHAAEPPLQHPPRYAGGGSARPHPRATAPTPPPLPLGSPRAKGGVPLQGRRGDTLLGQRKAQCQATDDATDDEDAVGGGGEARRDDLVRFKGAGGMDAASTARFVGVLAADRRRKRLRQPRRR